MSEDSPWLWGGWREQWKGAGSSEKIIAIGHMLIAVLMEGMGSDIKIHFRQSQPSLVIGWVGREGAVESVQDCVDGTGGCPGR